jgi:hypothetical protein
MKEKERKKKDKEAQDKRKNQAYQINVVGTGDDFNPARFQGEMEDKLRFNQKILENSPDRNGGGRDQ